MCMGNKELYIFLWEEHTCFGEEVHFLLYQSSSFFLLWSLACHCWPFTGREVQVVSLSGGRHLIPVQCTKITGHMHAWGKYVGCCQMVIKAASGGASKRGGWWFDCPCRPLSSSAKVMVGMIGYDTDYTKIEHLWSCANVVLCHHL